MIRQSAHPLGLGPRIDDNLHRMLTTRRLQGKMYLGSMGACGGWGRLVQDQVLAFLGLAATPFSSAMHWVIFCLATRAAIRVVRRGVVVLVEFMVIECSCCFDRAWWWWWWWWGLQECAKDGKKKGDGRTCLYSRGIAAAAVEPGGQIFGLLVAIHARSLVPFRLDEGTHSLARQIVRVMMCAQLAIHAAEWQARPALIMACGTHADLFRSTVYNPHRELLRLHLRAASIGLPTTKNRISRMFY
jgi:hypothetical protein